MWFPFYLFFKFVQKFFFFVSKRELCESQFSFSKSWCFSMPGSKRVFSCLFHKTDVSSHDRMSNQNNWFMFYAIGTRKCFPHFFYVMAINRNDFPSGCCKKFCRAKGHDFFESVRELNLVVIHENNQIIQLVFGRKIHHFIDLSFLRFAVPESSKYFPFFFFGFLCKGKSRCCGYTCSKWTCTVPYARNMSRYMSFKNRTCGTKIFYEFFFRNSSKFRENCINGWRNMTIGNNNRIIGMRDNLGIEKGKIINGAERSARVSTFCFGCHFNNCSSTRSGK